MASRAAVTKRKVKKPNAFRFEATRERSAAQWKYNENVGLKPVLSLDDLKFNWTGGGTSDLWAQGALTAITMENAIDSVPTITISVMDPDGELFNAKAGRLRTPAKKKTLVVKGRKVPAPPAMVDEGWNPIVPPEMMGNPMEVDIDGVIFRLVKVNYTHSTGAVELTFEHRIAYWLKRKKGEFRAARDQASITAASGGTLLYVGDSLGVGTAPELKKKASYGVADYCQVGMSSQWAEDQLNAHLGATHFAVVFDAGTNDGNSPGPFIDRLTAVKKKIGDRSMLVATMNGPAAAMNGALKTWAGKTAGVILVDWFAVSAAENLTGGDNIHPTAAGYTRRAGLFYDSLPKPGAAVAATSTPRTGGVTRAEFVLALLRQIQSDKPPFICPALHQKQKVAAQAQTASAGASTSTDTPSTGGGGFSPNAHITVKHATATHDQVTAIEGILGEAAKMGASREVMIACIMCATQESDIQPLNHGDAARNDTIGYFQQGPEWIDPADTNDPAKAVHAFLDGKNGNCWKKKYGNLSSVPGGYESAIKGVQVSVGGYGQWEQEATATVEAWGGAAGTSESTAASTTPASGGTKSYQFSRNKDESSFVAITRLAEEVNWRFFMVGKAVYYMSESDLYAQRPRYTVRPGDDSVVELTYDVDWGRPVSEATLSVNLDRWGTPVGSVVILEDFGPPDGRWLVVGTSRDWFSPTMEVTLRQPGKALLEPAAETKDASTSASASSDATALTGSVADKLYAAAQAISAKGYPYIWGGGHGGTAGVPSANPGSPHNSPGAGSSVGYDCSGSCCAALKAAGIAYTSGPCDVSGTMAGKGLAGPGNECTIHANGEHVFITFDKRNDRFDTSPKGGDKDQGRGPRLRGALRDTGGFTARHYEGM